MSIFTPVNVTNVDASAATASANCVVFVNTNVPVGALLIIFCMDDSTTVTGVVDSKGNVYNTDISLSDATKALGISVFSTVIENALTSSDTITISHSVAAPVKIYIKYALSTGWKSFSRDIFVTNNEPSQGWWTVGISPQTHQAEELIVALAAGTVPTSSSTPDSPWIELHDISGINISARMVIQYQIVDTIANYSGGGTWSANSASLSGIVSYWTAPTGGVVNPDLTKFPKKTWIGA